MITPLPDRTSSRLAVADQVTMRQAARDLIRQWQAGGRPLRITQDDEYTLRDAAIRRIHCTIADLRVDEIRWIEWMVREEVAAA
jgi:hypothetical protein